LFIILRSHAVESWNGISDKGAEQLKMRRMSLLLICPLTSMEKLSTAARDMIR
jgi:hypothetical protein